MNLKQYIEFAFSNPPHVVGKRVARTLKCLCDTVFLRWRDRLEPTYAEHFPQGAFQRYFSKVSIDFFQPHAEELLRFSIDYLAHRFDLLGSGPVEVRHGTGESGGKDGRWLEGRINKSNLEESKRIWGLVDEGYIPIDWHVDFKSGYRWREDIWCKDIRYGRQDGVDVKVPWELSRMQHLPVLAWSFALADAGGGGFEKPQAYLREFRNEILDFIATNPPRFGVNWACTMDVAIRVGNWLAAYDLFKVYGAEFDAEFEKVFLRSIDEHGRHIISNLEWSEELRSNHYLSDLAGLFCVAVYCPFLNDAPQWLEFSIAELEEEGRLQVYEDGCDFEASTCYHRLVLELFFYPAVLGKRHGVEFSSEYNAMLKRMFEAVLHLLKPDGRMPQIGDNDNGRFLKLGLPGTDVLDMRYLLPLAAVYFDDPHFKILYEADKGGADDLLPAIALFGPQGIKRWQEMPARSVEDIKSKAFPCAGWYVMRENDNYLIVSCGPNGQNGNGGHAHNDKLSFEWFLHGQNVIIDPGSYVYTSDPQWRNRFRSVNFHNTVTVDHKEQNRFSTEREAVFKMQDDSRSDVPQWQAGDQTDVFIGRHKGYARGNCQVVHQRKVVWNKTAPHQLEITDMFFGAGKHVLTWNFHVLPEVQKRIKITADPLTWRVEPAHFSSSYGKKINIFKMTAEITTEIPFEVKIIIRLS